MQPMQLALTQLPEDLRLVTQTAATVAQEQRARLYLVGGWVRDFVSRNAGHGARDEGQGTEADFAVAADPMAFASRVAERIGGRVVRLHDDPPTVRLVRWKNAAAQSAADFTALQGDLDDDLRRRDFTCNALAVDVVTLVQDGVAPIIDPLNGLAHLAQRQLVLTSKRALKDDPVRILRAFRFAATLGLHITEETQAALAENAPLLLNAAPERIAAEFAWTLQAPDAGTHLLAMDATGVLTFLLPELMPLKKVPAAGYHHLDGFHHTVQAVQMAERAIAAETEDDALNDLLKQVQPAFQVPFGYRRTGVWVVKFATLLHDIGKPHTMTVGADGAIHFYGHERVGAEIAEHICHRWRLSRRETETVTALVRWHMRPVYLAGARELTERALRRFWRALGDVVGIYCVVLSAADLMATRGLAMTPEHRQRHYLTLRRLLETHCALKAARQRPRIVTGHDIMTRYNLPPSPLVGRALQAVEEAVLDGRVRTKEDAWRLLDSLVPQWLTGSPSLGTNP